MKKQYSNLEVIIDAARTDSEVRYNLETKQATVYARTEDDAERGIADLEARGVLQAAAEPADDVSEERGFILQAFDHAADEMLNDETKAEALQLARLYVGNPDMPESSPMFSLMSGFIIGMSEGMRIADTLNAAAAEQAAQ